MMICEICKESGFDTVTYSFPKIIKINSCTSCIRTIDYMVSNAYEEYILSMRHKIQSMIDKSKENK